MVDGLRQPSEEGTMQGGPLSPLLSNIYLDDLDKELERRGLPFVRYADDFVIFTKSDAAAQRVYASVERFLRERLKLSVNQEELHPQDGWTGVCRLRVRGLWRPDSCEREEAGGIQTTRRGDLSQEPQRLDAVTLAPRSALTQSVGLDTLPSIK